MSLTALAITIAVVLAILALAGIAIAFFLKEMNRQEREDFLSLLATQAEQGKLRRLAGSYWHQSDGAGGVIRSDKLANDVISFEREWKDGRLATKTLTFELQKVEIKICLASGKPSNFWFAGREIGLPTSSDNPTYNYLERVVTKVEEFGWSPPPR